MVGGATNTTALAAAPAATPIASAINHSEIIYTPSLAPNTQLRQGEIITGLIQYQLVLDSVGQPELTIDEKIHPYAIILSQDCDLEQDFRIRNSDPATQRETDKVSNVLFCEVVTAENMRGVANVTGITTEIWKLIRQNKNDRYHFLEQVAAAQDATGAGLPELGLNFKRYFTIPTAEVYRQLEINIAQRRCRLISPYLEHLSDRYGNYLTRIALPEDHASI